MNQEILIICRHEVAKLMRDYEALSGKEGMPLNEIVDKNTCSIYLLAEVVQQLLLKDKE